MVDSDPLLEQILDSLAIHEIARGAAVSRGYAPATVSLAWLQCSKDETDYSNFTLNR